MTIGLPLSDPNRLLIMDLADVIAPEHKSLRDYHRGRGMSEEDARIIADQFHGQAYSDALGTARRVIEFLRERGILG